MSNLDRWLEENQWQLCNTEVKDLREAVAADIAEALKTAHNKQSAPLMCSCGKPAVRSHCAQCIEDMLNCVD
jgi:hypothetical protein